MANCGQACSYNTLDGCKVKEYNAICPLTNMATPVTEYRITNADRIRAMSDEELAELLESTHTNMAIKLGGEYIVRAKEYIGIWLKQPADNKCFPDGDGK